MEIFARAFEWPVGTSVLKYSRIFFPFILLFRSRKSFVKVVSETQTVRLAGAETRDAKAKLERDL